MTPLFSAVVQHFFFFELEKERRNYRYFTRITQSSESVCQTRECHACHRRIMVQNADLQVAPDLGNLYE